MKSPNNFKNIEDFFQKWFTVYLSGFLSVTIEKIMSKLILGSLIAAISLFKNKNKIYNILSCTFNFLPYTELVFYIFSNDYFSAIRIIKTVSDRFLSPSITKSFWPSYPKYLKKLWSISKFVLIVEFYPLTFCWYLKWILDQMVYMVDQKALRSSSSSSVNCKS